jgi:hypothetical protein
MGNVGGENFGPEQSDVVVAAAINKEKLEGRKLDLFMRMTNRGKAFRMRGMKSIITRKGHMGLAAHNVHVGDRIAILATGSAPFVLRKVSKENDHNAHILLGACYVDGEILALQHKGTRDTDVGLTGIMYGEAVRERLSDICQEVEELRYDPNLVAWMQDHPEMITFDSDGQIIVETDLAFLHDICLV